MCAEVWLMKSTRDQRSVSPFSACALHPALTGRDDKPVRSGQADRQNQASGKAVLANILKSVNPKRRKFIRRQSSCCGGGHIACDHCGEARKHNRLNRRGAIHRLTCSAGMSEQVAMRLTDARSELRSHRAMEGTELRRT